ncbi:MAG TPA: Ig-like domain-containing protein, partial [Haloferula sp.]
MKPTSCSTGALASYLAATLLFSAIPSVAQTVTNPGFDANNFTTFPGYASGNGGASSITGWTPAPLDRVGQNPAGSSPFANNGTIPSAPNVAFLQATGTVTPSLSTTVSGLTIGTKYNVSIKVNARSQTPANLPHLRFTVDGGAGTTVSAEVSAVGGTAPFRTASFEFTATATSHVITFTNTKPTVAPASSANGDHTLLLDSLTVVPSSNAWSFSPWTDDASSGVDSSYVYTHAFKLGNANTNVTINGVTFYGRQGALPGVYNLTGLTASAAFGAGVLQVTGNSAALASPFRYDGLPSVTLQNLKPSTQYVFTVYGAGWDAPTDPTPHRAATFSSSLGGDSFTANLDQYGKGQGMKVTYTYTTDSLGSPVTISYPSLSAGTFHTSAFSNRETTPRTATSNWSIHQWHDDTDSGISPNHVYTHAQSYGTTVSPNVNGVNFTGIAGINPSGTNCNVTLPTIYNGDTNSITGYGAALAKDFGYNGAPSVFNLSGLTAGKQYVFTMYSVGFGAGAREGAFYGSVPGEPPTILNQHAYGDNQGIRFDYQYTADASGTAKIMLHGITGTDTIHIYGSSNREANAMVGVAPSITLQPTGASIGIGATYTLRAGAIGSETLTYQWKKGTQDVPGATEPVLVIEDAEVADGGSYTLVVTNSVNSATSNAAVVSVLENVPGVFATGVNDFGQALPAGAIDSHYSLIVNPDNPSSTDVLVQNPIPGSWVPHTSTSTWVGPRAMTSGAAALNSDAGEGAGTYVYRTKIDLTGFDVSSVQISGTWATDNSGLAIRVNGAATGITNSTGVTYGVLAPFTINSTNAPSLTAGINNIDFVVNNADAVTGYTGLHVENLHAIGVVPLNTAPHIVVQPKGGVGPHDGVFTVGVGASGSATLAYQWYLGNDPIPGATSATYEVPIENLASGGNYKVRVSNSVSFVDSNVATVTVTNANPVIVDDNLSGTEGVPLEIDATFDLIANDTDADGDSLTLATFSATSFNGGTITLNEGVLTYTPAPGFDGLDGFTYSVSDGWGGTSAAGTVLITVNAAVAPAPGP